jgi:hypothetical protein
MMAMLEPVSLIQGYNKSEILQTQHIEFFYTHRRSRLPYVHRIRKQNNPLVLEYAEDSTHRTYICVMLI